MKIFHNLSEKLTRFRKRLHFAAHDAVQIFLLAVATYGEASGKESQMEQEGEDHGETCIRQLAIYYAKSFVFS